MNQKPTKGRIVNVVIKNSNGFLVIRPAIVTHVWEQDSPICIQATAFPDAANDGLGNAVGLSSLMPDETAKIENTWHWPVCEMPLGVRFDDWVGLYKQAAALCADIEQLPASGQATNLSLKASDLLQAIQKASNPQS
jgi:hypothetical protein